MGVGGLGDCGGKVRTEIVDNIQVGTTPVRQSKMSEGFLSPRTAELPQEQSIRQKKYHLQTGLKILGDEKTNKFAQDSTSTSAKLASLQKEIVKLARQNYETEAELKDLEKEISLTLRKKQDIFKDSMHLRNQSHRSSIAIPSEEPRVTDATRLHSLESFTCCRHVRGTSRK
eukprot:CAMPEP_0114486368 /NCGR_PEP_ID=MMETSP0109-20121206/179_1 /TAXON_ID=29199 /ORGANISM="Chlorarachnion reptans, Strain CCCM449" /LENGTH=171 /DNA_ID=CAMNT_0001662529 /DNA_START=264 /DNA_END=779 /DNA_ORIENTATION=-